MPRSRSSLALCVLALSSCDHPPADAGPAVDALRVPPADASPTVDARLSADASPAAGPVDAALVPADAATANRPDATAPRELPRRPAGALNVVLLTVDSLRGDIFFPRSPEGQTTHPIAPNVAAVAARAVTYTRAYALSSYTSASVAGFSGGRLPGEMRRDGVFFNAYPDSDVMFPERLHAAGVRTMAAQAHFYFERSFGLAQGFDVWQLVPGIHPNTETDTDVTDGLQEDLAERQLGDPANTSARFFAWYHFMDPHDAYMSHPGIGPYGRFARDRYDAEVTWTDQHLEKLLEFIQRQPWAGRTAVIISADHGEQFREHGSTSHGFELWQELVHVPLFFLIPGAAPRRIDVARSHADLAPTVLDLMGLAPAADLPGTSLVPECFGAPTPARDVWIDLPRTTDNDRRRALIHGRYKVIAYGDDSRFEVYDLETDPTERRDLRATDRATYDAMVALYRAGQAGIHDVHPYRMLNLVGAPPGRGY